MEKYSDSTSFRLKLNNGYIFRNIFEYLKLTNTKGIFIFYRDCIIYEQIDRGIKILNKIFFDTSKVAEYFYDCEEDNFKIGFNIVDIRCITKLINKNDSLTLYKNKNENFIHVDIIHSALHKVSQNTVLIRYLEDTIMEVPEYSDSCNVIEIKSAEFSKMCSNMSAIKCDMVKFELYKTGIKCVGTTFNISKHEEILGSIYEKERIETFNQEGKKIIINKSRINNIIDKIFMHLKTIKSISKISNLANKSILYFSIESGLPLKITANIDDFGEINVYLKSENHQE